jgi:two-component system phosphate regulon response regulator PhoB
MTALVKPDVELSRNVSPTNETKMPKPKVLIIEDDPDLTEVLRYNLDQAGYEVLNARDGAEGLRQARLTLPDIVILDLMLPLLDGFEVCRRLRAEAATAHLLILMLTAKSEETDQVVGLSLGADDYVTKPFSVKVLMERIKALRRRRNDTGVQEVVASQGIQIDRLRHQAMAGGEALQLTPTEFRILETLVRQPGRAYHRAELIETALGKDSFVLERTIDVHIRALRRKLGAHSQLIETVRGLGYRFKDERA